MRACVLVLGHVLINNQAKCKFCKINTYFGAEEKLIKCGILENMYTTGNN